MLRNLFAKTSIVLAASLALNACSTTNTPTSSTTAITSAKPQGEIITWQQRETALNQIKNWEVNGKIGVETQHDRGSATVQWVQNNQHYNVSLIGPLGAGGLKLSGQPGNVTATAADGKRATASSPEELLRKVWGFNLPVSNLVYWIRGLPAPNMSSQKEFDSSNRLTRLSQQGWSIQYASYTRKGQVDLPDRIYISSSQLKTKLVIYDWRVAT